MTTTREHPYMTQEGADELAEMHLVRLVGPLKLIGGIESAGGLITQCPDPKGGYYLEWTDVGCRFAGAVRELAEQSAETLMEALVGRVPGTVDARRLREAQTYCAVLALALRGLEHQEQEPGGLRDAWVASGLLWMLEATLKRAHEHGADWAEEHLQGGEAE